MDDKKFDNQEFIELKEYKDFVDNSNNNGDNQDKIAQIIKVDQSNYSKYELGKILIHTYPLIDFAKHYKVSIDYLCGKIEDKKIK